MAPPYLEDYYYQAFVSKYYDGKNSDVFAPESVRELAPTEKVAAENVAFVKLEGLGRVAFSNIRRPRPLMDVSIESVNKATEDREDTSKPHAKRLEQEPALAARIMIEDCMALILDVEDVDRIFIASQGENLENKDALKQRRTLLVEGLASSLRLSEHPQGKVDSDSVFLKLLSRNKGITLAIRAMKITFPPEEMNRGSSTKVTPNYRILWALLRRIGTIYRSELLQNSQAQGFLSVSLAVSPGLKNDMLSEIPEWLRATIASPNACGDLMLERTSIIAVARDESDSTISFACTGF
jgi:DNA topoisomerase 2-associated protein PAT1